MASLFFGGVNLSANDVDRQDSLQQLISQARDDENKVKLLLDLSKSFSQADPDQAISAALSAYSLAGGLDYDAGRMKASTQLGILYKGIAAFDTAMHYLEISIHIADSLNDRHQLATDYNEYGSILRRKGFYSSALEYHKKSLQFSRLISDTLNMANASIYAAMILHDKMQFDSAVAYYFTALRMYEMLGNKRNIGVVFLNIGDLYYDQNEPGKAIGYYRKGLPLFREVNDLRLTGQSYNKIGMIHSYDQQYDSALYYYMKARVIFDSINNRSGLGHLNINIGNVYTYRGQYEEAMIHYDKAISAFREMGFQGGYKNALMALAGMYKKQERYPSALETYMQCIEIARQVDPQALVDVYADIVDIYRILGNTGKALEYQDLYIAVKDSVFEIEKVEAIADAELKYEKEKNQARILAMEKVSLEKDIALERRTRQRNSYLYGGAGAVLVLVFLFSFYSLRSRKNKIIAEQKILQLEEEKKLLAARSIVEGQEEERKRIAKELHDGLGVILSTAKMHFTTFREKSPEAIPLMEKAAELLEQASGDVRRISHNMMPGLLTKFGLYEAVEDLIEQVDDMEGITAQVMIEGEQQRLPENMEIMLYRIIQELVNNTLKHASAHIVRLKIGCFPDHLRFEYSDDGKGFNPAQVNMNESMGLQSIQSRIKFLGGEYSLEAAPDSGVKYDIKIPLN